jgi:hypothetical protein
LIKHLKEVATPPRKLRGDIPVAVERVVTQAMEKKPELRQRSAQEIVAALRSAQAKLAQESSQPTLAATQPIDWVDIEAERGVGATKKSWLRNFVSWRGGGGREPPIAEADRPPDDTAAVELSDVAPTPTGGATMAETMIAPAQADGGASKRATWKLAAGGLALAVLLGAGLLAVYPDRKTKSNEGSRMGPQKSLAPAGGENIVSLAIGGNKEELSVGDRVKFVLTVERENGRRDEMTERAHWSSSNPAVLATAGGGEFVAKDPGTVDVVAEYEGMPAPPVTLIVHAGAQSVPAKKAELVSLAIEPANTAIEVNERLALRITGKYSDGKEQQLKGARWESSDRTVVAVNASGELAGRRTGTAQISASYRGLKSEPVLVSVTPPQTKSTAMVRNGSVAPKNKETRLSTAGKESETRMSMKESPAPDPSKTVKTDSRPGYAELKEPPIKKSTPPPEISIKEHIKSARQYRDRGDYAAAFVELERARRIDGTNQEIQAEITVTRRACNAERSLGRPDLKCGG